MNYRCRLGSFGNSSTASGSSRPEGTKGSSYIVKAKGLIFFVPSVLYMFTLLLCFFVIFRSSVIMQKCLGKHSCMSSPFPIAILNGTCFFARRNSPLDEASPIIN